MHNDRIEHFIVVFAGLPLPGACRLSCVLYFTSAQSVRVVYSKKAIFCQVALDYFNMFRVQMFLSAP